MTYRGHIKNGLVVFDERVALPEGAEVRVEPVPTQGRMTLAERFKDVIGCISDLPPDMAENHDHSIHGTGKDLPRWPGNVAGALTRTELYEDAE
jgi:hypothetical protein